MCMIKAHIMGHTGKLNIRTGELSFYGIKTKDVFGAFTLLKDLNPSHSYRIWTLRGKKALENTADGWFYVQGRWLPDKDMARDYVKNRCQL